MLPGLAGLPGFLGPAAAAAPGKRYWRMLISSVNGDPTPLCNLSEIGLAESKGGTNIANLATVTANATGFGSASNLVNGNRTDIWESSGALPFWLRFDFGAGSNYQIGEVRVVHRTSWSSRAPKDWKLQSSPDGSTWTDELTVTGATSWLEGVIAGGTAVGISNVYHTAGCPDGNAGSLFCKINLTTTDGGSAFAGTEAELRTSIGGSDVVSTSPFIYSNNIFGSVATFGPQQLFDNSTSSLYSSNNTTGVFVLLEFDTAQDIKELSWTARTGGNQNQSPAAGNVALCDTRDGTFSAAFSWSGSTGWTSGQSRTFS